MIAAAGSGERLGAGGPKAFVPLAGRPLIGWCLEAFARADRVEAAVVAAPEGRLEQVRELAPEGLALEVVAGGETRAESVAAALDATPAGLVAVHDAARPLVTAGLIDTLIARLLESPDADGVIAARPLTDTVKQVARGKRQISRTERRDELWAAQTPQVFHARALREAHSAPPRGEATDDAMLVEQAGGTVLVEPAPAWNLKVTTPEDLRVAEMLLGLGK